MSLNEERSSKWFVVAEARSLIRSKTTNKLLQQEITCEDKKMTLCKRTDICPDGELATPVGGQRNQDT